MSDNFAHLGLSIDSPLVSEAHSNYRPSSWPPAPDFPIVIDAEGVVISRYRDSVWNLTVWAGKSVIINFGDSRLSIENAQLLKVVVAWWLYGPAALRHAVTLRQAFYDVRPVFALCTAHGVLASNLWRFPAVVDEIPSVLKNSSAVKVLSRLHVLYSQRGELGFHILDHEGLSRLESSLPDPSARQTEYIPPRIWQYQIGRLKEFLEDFIENRSRIDSCFKFCLDAYAVSKGDLGEACRVGRKKKIGPFFVKPGRTGVRTGPIYCGPFSETAREFGIDQMLRKWCGALTEDNYVTAGQSVRLFSTYLTMANYVGMAFILNFALMRVNEANSLHSDCLEVENDERFGPIYILHGRTTKTIDDDDARWPTSPLVSIAVDVMSCVGRLRIICAEANPDVPTGPDDVRNPPLIVRAYEPWSSSNAEDMQKSLSIRPNLRTYAQVVQEYPNLMNLDELKITENDFRLALLVNPTLDAKKFGVGKVWTLGWHQLRRTGAVNMQASGLVSDATLQYLLKHVRRAMSLYYGQGYSRLRLDDKARLEYIRTMYEILGKEISSLLSDRYFSPHGEKRKTEILNAVSYTESKKLADLARAGAISWRVNSLGGCTKRGPCPYGGVDNLVRCGGGDGSPPCADVLFDKENGPQLSRLSDIIQERIAESPVNSPDRESLEAQGRAVRNALNAIES